MNPRDQNFVPPANGGTAFPSIHSLRSDNAGGFRAAGAPGMSTLDYVAASVLPTILNNEPEESDENIVGHAYDLAEAFIAEKQRRNSMPYPRQ